MNADDPRSVTVQAFRGGATVAVSAPQDSGADWDARGRQALALVHDIMVWKLEHRHWWQRAHRHVWWLHWHGSVRVCRRCGLVDAVEVPPQ